MIDLHMHTTYSDGTYDLKTVLKKAEEKKLNIIAITDHNVCGAYDELNTFDVKEYYSGRIIKGVEMNTKVLGIPIEILGYNINPEILKVELKKAYITNTERNILEVKRLAQKCKEHGIDIGENFVENYNPEMYASKYLHGKITSNPNNKGLIDEESWENSNVFYRKYMSNPETMFYVNMDDVLPDFEEACNIVRRAGGLVFLPHIYEYRENSDKILKYILENHKIDGIECYYTTFTEEQHKYLLNLCKERNLLVSGGSDYHGNFKPDVDLGVGYGNLKIPDEIVENWCIKTKIDKIM